MIRYLNQEEKKKSRKMYEANFPEDSREFVDYYYKYKTADNQILVMEEQLSEPGQESSQLQVMMHLNPYEFYMCGEMADVNYIVAVATDATVRKQGKMAEVMKQALQDMTEAHQPFAFLIPANPKVYISSGFTFVPAENYADYRQQLEEMKEQSIRAAELSWDITLREAKTADIPTIVKFSNRLFRQEYDVFPFRTEDFYERKLAEMESENGALMLMLHRGKIVGMFSYGKEGAKVELQEILAAPDYRDDFVSLVKDYFSDSQIDITEMNFMVRILDLKVLGLLLRSESPFSLKVQVRDTVIPSNEGCFEIRADKTGSSITAISKEEAECTMDISQLTEVLFEKVKLFVREWV